MPLSVISGFHLPEIKMTNRLISLLGILTILGVAFLLSRDRKAIRGRIVAWGLGLQLLVALFVLRTQLGYRLLDRASKGMVWFLSFSFEGSKFVFGPLGDQKGPFGLILAFQALPIIIFVACFFSILYYLRVLPMLVLLMGRSEEHTSELQSLAYLVCRLLLEKKKKPASRGVLRGSLRHHSGLRSVTPVQ